MLSEETRIRSHQQYGQSHQEFDQSLDKTAKIAKKGMSNMAPNFRLIKFIHEEMEQTPSLSHRLKLMPSNFKVTSVRAAIMKLIANVRHANPEFNRTVQMLTSFDRQKANELKDEGLDNPRISEILSSNPEMKFRVGNLVKAINNLPDEFWRL